MHNEQEAGRGDLRVAVEWGWPSCSPSFPPSSAGDCAPSPPLSLWRSSWTRHGPPPPWSPLLHSEGRGSPGVLNCFAWMVHSPAALICDTPPRQPPRQSSGNSSIGQFQSYPKDRPCFVVRSWNFNRAENRWTVLLCA